MAVSHQPASSRPLRADAERNRARLLEAAGELFARKGLSVGLDEIARHAGVGVGTAYRRFPDKEQLVDSLFESELDAIVRGAEEALAMADPWEAVVHLFTSGLERAAANVGLLQLITGSRHGAAKVDRARDRLGPLTNEVIERARAAGVVRPDAAAQDVPVTMMMLAPLIEAGREIAPDLWRRHLALILDGLRADVSGRGALPPTVADDAMGELLVASHRPRSA